MALSLTSIPQSAPITQKGDGVSALNDAFSFWKLPENWRDELEPVIEGSGRIATYYLLEKYLGDGGRRPPALLRAYYPFKAFIPSRQRHFINSLVIRTRPRADFPHWPCENALLDFWREWLRMCLRRIGKTDEWHIGFWPEGRKCCIVLTHDVDSGTGFERIERMADLEEKHGFRSAWNLPLAQYRIDWNLVERLRSRGFEFGAHGLCHDGRLFRSRKDFDALAPLLERLASAHNLTGFRAPSTLRRAEWLATMAFEFDTSFSDTDPFEPQAGGTCSVFPFFLSNMVELPYTLPQDHTLIHILKRDPLLIWTLKAQWISRKGGMILALTHPDYCCAPPYLSEYEEFLKRLREIQNSWCALPSEVARWWRCRSRLQLFIQDGKPLIRGPDNCDAMAVRLRAEPLIG